MSNGRNYGLLFEEEMAGALNKQKYSKLSKNLQTFIKDVFGYVKPNEKIHCKALESRIKPDIEITVGKITKYVSLKSGRAMNVHSERIETIIPFLREIGVPENHLKTLCLFHFGDGTYNGNGKERYDVDEVHEQIRGKIIAFNRYICQHGEILEKVIERVMFQGVVDSAHKATFIYHGDLNYGIAVSRVNILKHFENKKYMYIKNPHFGPLNIKPHARYAHGPVKNEMNRRMVDFYWNDMREGLLTIYNRYGNFNNY